MDNKELNWYLYVLKCEGNRYYVGIAYDLEKRIKAHLFQNSKGAKMTEIYHPISIERTFSIPTSNREDAAYFENLVTLKLHEDGKKVSGGSYLARDDAQREKAMTYALKRKNFNIEGNLWVLNFDDISQLEKEDHKELNERIFSENTELLKISRMLVKMKGDITIIQKYIESKIES